MVKQPVRGFLIIGCYLVSNFVCFPLAYILGAMISGWDRRRATSSRAQVSTPWMSPFRKWW
jgi:hypothetical protein